MLKIPRFLINDSNINSSEIQSRNFNLILVESYKNEGAEKDLLKKICQSVNLFDYEVKIVDNLEDFYLSELYKEFNQSNFNSQVGSKSFTEINKYLFEFNKQNLTSSVESKNGFLHLKTFSLSQLSENKDFKLDLWNVLKSFKAT